MNNQASISNAENAASGAPEAVAAAELRGLVRRNNRQWTRLILLEAVAGLVAACLGYLWIVFGLDNILHLSVGGRILASGCFLAVLAGFLLRCLRRRRRARFSNDQVALAIERRMPVPMANRLINLIQLAREAGGQPASQAAIAENCRHLRQMRLEPAARSLPALVHAGLALFLALVGVGFWFFQRERFTNAATRIFLPLARVAPVYRTLLTVEPGDLQAAPGADVTITARIAGRIPATLAVFRRVNDRRSADEIKVPPGAARADYTFRAVAESFAYAVRGGDYVSPFYTVTVPVPCELQRLAAVLHAPDYARQPAREQEGPAGDLEALAGTRAELRFTFSRPLEKATLLLETAPGPAAATDPAANVRSLPLARLSPTEFSGALVFQEVRGYQLAMVRPGQPAALSRKYLLRELPDLPPDLQLSGIAGQMEILSDSVVPVTLAARDDYGLAEVGLFFRAAEAPAVPDPAIAPGARDGGTPAESTNAWQALQTWPVAGAALFFQTNAALSAAALGAVEGETLQLAVRGRDTDPRKGGQWTTGPLVCLAVGGAGAELQRLYERILKTENDLRALIPAQEGEMERSGPWMRKLESGSGVRWDDRKNLDELAAALREQARCQAELRTRTAGIAQSMREETGNLRLAVELLADTEMMRAERIIGSVAGRDSPAAKRAALADARLTGERIVLSLREILDQYVRWRQDWEMANMLPFTRMLAERQQRMVGEARAYAGQPEVARDNAVRNGAWRRQAKLGELAGLAQTAFAGMGGRVGERNPLLAGAFIQAAAAFDTAGSGVKPLMGKAADCLQAGQWSAAATNQQAAVAALVAIHARLLKLQAEAARQTLAEVQKLAAESVEAQQAIARLQPGTNQGALAFAPGAADAGEVIRMQELAAELKKKKHPPGGDHTFDYLFENVNQLDGRSRPAGADFSILSLAAQPSGQMSSPDLSDRAPNSAAADPLAAKFQDLVGDLLEEADDLREKYETYNLNLPGQGLEPGAIGKQGGDMNALHAAAATGNMKPPTQNFGGASRSGRQGARAHGLVVGDESVNRRGRDAVQEGQEEVPDQDGVLKEIPSEDMQPDASTGVGGKLVGTPAASFSTNDAGEWKDEMVKRLNPARDKNQIVERQDKPLHPQVAEMMRDLAGSQEQVIERIKSIKKELDNLYLPTEHLDQISAALRINLDRLRQSPDPEIFRRQAETLDKLKGAIVVLDRPASDFQPSLVRPQAVRGRILDEPAWPAPPGYEEAVKRYFEKLAAP